MFEKAKHVLDWADRPESPLSCLMLGMTDGKSRAVAA